MFEIEKFIPYNRELDAGAIRDAGFYSKPLPELFSAGELRDIANLLGERSFRMWSYEYGEPPEFHGDRDIDTQTSEFSSVIYKNILISFGSDEIFFWLPEDHEYVVVFGTKPAVNEVVHRVFEYNFEEYMNDEYSSINKYERLLAIKKQYDFS